MACQTGSSAALSAGAALALSAAAQAQAYPSKNVRVVVPFAAAGPTDVIARIVGQKLVELYGQQFDVENVPGAGGNTGTAQVAKAPADGYTLLVVSTGFIVNPSLYAKVPYDPVKDFAPVTLVAASPNVLVVNPDVPAKIGQGTDRADQGQSRASTATRSRRSARRRISAASCSS